MVETTTTYGKLSDNEIKHLEMVESVIGRMGQNSFALKGWAMTLVVAICALSATGSEKKFVLVAIIPLLAFWFLDSFYLQKERKYCDMYSQIISQNVVPFSMDISKIKTAKTKYIKCLFSVTEWTFYIACLAGVIAVFLWLILA